MNNGKNDGGLMGRLTALALILGVAYGVHSISRGGLGCPLGDGSCCSLAVPHDEAHEHEHEHAAAEKASPAKFDADSAADLDEDAKLEKKAPVALP